MTIKPKTNRKTKKSKRNEKIHTHKHEKKINVEFENFAKKTNNAENKFVYIFIIHENVCTVAALRGVAALPRNRTARAVFPPVPAAAAAAFRLPSNLGIQGIANNLPTPLAAATGAQAAAANAMHGFTP